MKSNRTFRFLAAIAAMSIAAINSCLATDAGINRLIAVTQMKADAANEEALKGAEKQQNNVATQKRIRAAQRRLRD